VFCDELSRNERWGDVAHIVKELGSANVAMVMAKLWELRMWSAVFVMEQVNAQLAMELAKCFNNF
jgi:hypothetical protein